MLPLVPNVKDSELRLPAEFFSGAPDAVPERLLTAALYEFATKGFHAATTRAIGERAGVSPAGVYVHYKAKTDLLFEITRRGHRSCLDAVEAVLADAPPDPTERMRQFVKEFARWHAVHRMLARVSQYELNALPARQLQQIVKLRRQFDEHLRRELEAGMDAGVFSVDDINGTASAVLSLCIDLARWYRPRPPRQPEQIAEFYADLALRLAGSGKAT